MVKYGDTFNDKGAPTCSNEEVTTLGGARHSWSVVRNNGNNAWYVNMNNGNMNNNNVNNRYVGVGVSELPDDVFMRFLEDEELCYKNKHDSYSAQRVHFHLSDVYKLAHEIVDGTWNQGTAIVFAIQYPTLREVWASAYTDRILHHDIAPILIEATERVHNDNCNVSHGNRLGYSAHTASLQIWNNMQKFPNGYVGKRDLSGFFMSIPRENACSITMGKIGKTDKDWLIRKLIVHTPIHNCEAHSPQVLLDRIPINKSLFHAEEGRGLPIGNFYSQLVANLYLYSVDALASSDKWKGRIGYTRFVDDMCVVGNDVKSVNEFFADAEKEINRLGLRMNEHKKYMQPVKHGVSFCGRTIKLHGIYINNRTIKACKNGIKTCPDGLEGAKMAIRRINSYFGFFSHCKAFHIQQRLAKIVEQRYGEFVTQSLRHGQIVFHLAYCYSDKAQAKKNINSYIDNIKFCRYEIRQDYKRLNGYQGSRRKRSRKSA